MNEYQRIDVLINNVGGTDPKRDLSIEKLDIKLLDEAFHLNLCCTMYLSQQVILSDCQWWWEHCQRSFHKRTYG